MEGVGVSTHPQLPPTTRQVKKYPDERLVSSRTDFPDTPWPEQYVNGLTAEASFRT